jgi:ABC-type branched-subunit amino acid transport system ATPase component
LLIAARGALEIEDLGETCKETTSDAIIGRCGTRLLEVTEAFVANQKAIILDESFGRIL